LVGWLVGWLVGYDVLHWFNSISACFRMTVIS